MMCKMAARVLKYKLGSSSYGNSKLEKCKSFKKTIIYIAIFKPGLWRMDFLDMAKNGTIISSS